MTPISLPLFLVITVVQAATIPAPVRLEDRTAPRCTADECYNKFAALSSSLPIFCPRWQAGSRSNITPALSTTKTVANINVPVSISTVVFTLHSRITKISSIISVQPARTSFVQTSCCYNNIPLGLHAARISLDCDVQVDDSVSHDHDYASSYHD